MLSVIIQTSIITSRILLTWSFIEEDKKMKPNSSLPLLLLSFLYRGILTSRKILYRLRILKTHRFSCPVISVGNITVGGTGKTPTVCDIARRIEKMGKRPVILSRGYRRRSKEPYLIASDGEGTILPWQEIGDEPAMMARSLPGVPLLVGASRAQTGQVAKENFSPDVIVLDDGYQHIAVHRDLNILVIDASNPFGNRHVLPGGIMRESMANIARADAYLLTRTDQADETGKLVAELERMGKPIFHSVHHPTHLTELGTGKEVELDALVRRKGMSFCGIGSPAAFGKTLLSLDYTLVGEERFPDHYGYQSDDIDKLKQKAEELRADYLITTEKDAIRLPEDCREGVWSLGVSLQITGDQAGWEKLIGQVSG